ncbi:MAG: dihydrodipicolinate synthase family protein [Chloroflexota bacterium]
MKLAGVYAALVTPLTDGGELNSEALGQLLDHVIAGGANGVSVLGSTGESASLSPRLRALVVREAVRLCHGRVLMAAGVADSSTEATIEQINGFAESGLELVLVSPPFYYPPSQEEVVRFYEEVAARTPLPIVLYNIPHFTKVRIEPNTAMRLAKDKRIVGIKDSSRDFDYFLALLQGRDPASDFSILTGTDTQLVAALMSGADGTWAASLNVAPRLDVEILAAKAGNDWERAQRLQRRVIQLVSICRRGTFPAGWKAALETIGIPAGPPAFPTLPLSGEELSTLRRRLESFDLPRP